VLDGIKERDFKDIKNSDDAAAELSILRQKIAKNVNDINAEYAREFFVKNSTHVPAVVSEVAGYCCHVGGHCDKCRPADYVMIGGNTVTTVPAPTTAGVCCHVEEHCDKCREDNVIMLGGNIIVTPVPAVTPMPAVTPVPAPTTARTCDCVYCHPAM
jgi:hypothetical protein